MVEQIQTGQSVTDNQDLKGVDPRTFGIPNHIANLYPDEIMIKKYPVIYGNCGRAADF